MHLVSDLPAALQARLGTHDVIVFDGECVLCHGFFDFVLKRDRHQRFRFMHAQSDLGAALYAALDLPTQDFETALAIVDGAIYGQAAASGEILHRLGGIWAIVALYRFLPRWLTDPLYHLIARNRYTIFGRRDVCHMPGPDIVARFLDLGRAEAAQ